MRDALVAEENQTVWLVATGALTNVALLFATFPELVGHVKGLSIMGGAIGGGFTDAPLGKVKGEGERFGNTTRWAEFNIYVRLLKRRQSINGGCLHYISAIQKQPNLYFQTRSWRQKHPLYHSMYRI